MSTASQKIEDAHEIETKLAPGSMLTGDDQLVPSQVTALPPPPTAMQKLADGHEIALNPPAGSTCWGTLQDIGPDEGPGVVEDVVVSRRVGAVVEHLMRVEAALGEHEVPSLQEYVNVSG